MTNRRRAGPGDELRDRDLGRLLVTASGRGRFHAVTVPYFPEAAIPLLADVQRLILVETQAPVAQPWITRSQGR